MNSAVLKKSILTAVFLMICSFSSAQNIKIIGTIPRANTGKTYQLQIGAFRLDSNIKRAADILTKNGFVPRYEKIGDLTRVFVIAAASEVRTAINRLDCAGFKEVIIREYTARVEAPRIEIPESDPPRSEPRAEKKPLEVPVLKTPFVPVEETLEETPEETAPAGDIEIPEEILEFDFEEEFKPADEIWYETPEYLTVPPLHDLLHL